MVFAVLNTMIFIEVQSMKSTKEIPAHPLKIIRFVTGHQSIYATRMKTEEVIPIAEGMDNCGFWAMEVGGGATFDTMPMPIDKDLAQNILKNYKRGQTPITCRPTDDLPPEMEDAKKAIGDLARTDEDLPGWTLFPQTMGKYLQTKCAADAAPLAS